MILKDSTTIIRTTSVKNELGMHARPASRIAQIAESAQFSIWIHANSTRVDATSILDILTLCAVKGTEIGIEIENRKDMDILDRIIDYFETGFGESQG